jgi:hypothetical protein
MATDGPLSQGGQTEQAWVITPIDGSGKVELTLRSGPPRPLVATLTEAELTSVADVLRGIAAAVGRGEFSRIQLGAAFQDAIGRDPFRQVTADPRRRGLSPWWADLAYIVVGLGFAADVSNTWLRLAGIGLAAAGFVDLLRRAVRRRSRR